MTEKINNPQDSGQVLNEALDGTVVVADAAEATQVQFDRFMAGRNNHGPHDIDELDSNYDVRKLELRDEDVLNGARPVAQAVRRVIKAQAQLLSGLHSPKFVSDPREQVRRRDERLSLRM